MKSRIELGLFDEERELVRIAMDTDFLKAIFKGFDLKSFLASVERANEKVDELWKETLQSTVKRKGGWPKGKPRKPK